MNRSFLSFALLTGMAISAAGRYSPSKPASTAPTVPAQNQPGAPQTNQPPAVATSTTPAKVTAKTKEEFAAYNAADALIKNDADLSKGEAAAADFQTRFPQSALTSILYQSLMAKYQQANNSKKAVGMGRKVLAVDPDSVFAMITVATSLAESTRETDLDWSERYAEIMKHANRAVEMIDSGTFRPPQLSPDQLNTVKSMAYAAMGSIEFTKSGDSHDPPSEQAKHDAAAEQNLRKATELNTLNPEPSLWLRLAITLDHEKKLPEALTVANRAAALSSNDPELHSLVVEEQSRLHALMGNGPPASSQAEPARNHPAPSAPGTQPVPH